MSQASSSTKRQLRSHVFKTYKNNAELDADIVQDAYMAKTTKAQPYDIENSKTKKLKTMQKQKDTTSTSLPDTTTHIEGIINTPNDATTNILTSKNSQAKLSHDLNDNQQAQNQSTEQIKKIFSSENQTARSTPKLATDEMIELLELETSQDNPHEYKHFELFIPRDSFPKENKIIEIINFIKNAFVNEKDFFEVHSTKHLTYEIFILRFIKEETKNKYKNKLHPIIQKPLYDYTNENVQALIQQKLEDISNRSIRLVDIPHKLDFNLIIAHLANITGVSITHHKDITPKQRHINKKSPQPTNRKSPARPPLRQLLVRFEKESATKYLYENDHWTLAIGNSLIRILHPDIAHEISAQRTSYRYLIRGLLLNTDIRDMIPILKAIKGRTCTFNATSRNSISKTAFVYTNKENYTKEPHKIQKTTLQNHNIFIVAQDYKGDSCTICGNPQHTYENCNSEHRLDPNGSRKIYSPKYLKKDRTKLENNQDINNKYRHIISPKRKNIPNLSVSTFRNQNGKRPIVPTISNNRPNAYADSLSAKPQPSIQPQLNARHEKQLIEANERILKLEKALNNLSTKYDKLEQEFKTINIQHNT
ncbi:hypothetical protein RclHR1_02250012 [Rhizophagus clarus]|uniref:CCHC-type domain-containing protein n=1 Tax=Rhizophagus clarus TaxID=94130 RepID=A0A2Z6QZ77_9GLOM|nr:hypothetical protein RclHR1_02250012 [Rhizophagus clarus]GES82288.1 hypothetical protein GLOIN_2v1471680 [Rhizophagus clarus]